MKNEDCFPVNVGSPNIFSVKAVSNSAQLNGKPYNQCFIDHKDIIEGGLLEPVMGSRPSAQWGIQ